MYQFRDDTVAVRQQLLGIGHHETQIICLSCAKNAAASGLAHLFEGQLRQDEITKHQFCPSCGRIIGEITIKPPMTMAEYQDFRMKLMTMEGEDLVNLLSLALADRPDMTPINKDRPYGASTLRYTPHACPCPDDGCSQPAERVFQITISEVFDSTNLNQN